MAWNTLFTDDDSLLEFLGGIEMSSVSSEQLIEMIEERIISNEWTLEDAQTFINDYLRRSK